MLGTSMATEKHKNPFRFLQRAALMSRQWEQELELELKLKLGSTEAAGNRCGIVVGVIVVLKLIAKQKGMRATTAYPDHVRINNKRSRAAHPHRKHRQSGQNK